MGLLDFLKDDEDIANPQRSDKRRAPRWNVSVPAKIKFDGNNGYTDCEIRDLNLKGFSLLVPKKIIKKRIGSKLCFSEKYAFKIETRILWSKVVDNKYAYGMEFTKILDSDRGRILQMMKEDFPANVWKSL